VLDIRFKGEVSIAIGYSPDTMATGTGPSVFARAGLLFHHLIVVLSNVFANIKHGLARLLRCVTDNIAKVIGQLLTRGKQEFLHFDSCWLLVKELFFYYKHRFGLKSEIPVQVGS
jgi:hypothetical protein